MGNLGKVLSWWREIDWRACFAYCVTAVPAAALGVRTLLALPPHAVELALGVFFVAMVPARRWLARHAIQFSLLQLGMIGAVVGFLTGIVVSTGPITVPVFMGYGLIKGAFLATEATGSLAVAFIVEKYPDQTPRKYDCRSWGHVLSESRMFELQYRTNVDDSRVAWFRVREANTANHRTA